MAKMKVVGGKKVYSRKGKVISPAKAAFASEDAHKGRPRKGIGKRGGFHQGIGNRLPGNVAGTALGGK